jgi:hypothetical protein
MPRQHPFSRYANSAHYGLVGWDVGGPLFRFSVGPVPSPVDSADAHYPFLPAAHRERHHAAVEAIRRLGGEVGIHWGYCPHKVPDTSLTNFNRLTKFSKRWRTVVHLSEQWRGGAEGLSQLAALHNLADLYLVRAPVSDAEMRLLGDIGSLESLYLVETPVTDAGLAPLDALEELIYLRLEGAAGDEFTHRGLTCLTGLPKLRKLTLYGHGFTDEAVKPLEMITPLEELTLLDTKISVSPLLSLAASRKAARRAHYKLGPAERSSPPPRPFLFRKNPTRLSVND